MKVTEYQSLLLSVPLLLAAVAGEDLFPLPFFLMAFAAGFTVFFLAIDKPRLETEEFLALGALIWGGVAAVASSPDFSGSRMFIGAWFIAWLVFVVLRRSLKGERSILRLLLGAGAILLGLGILAEYLGIHTPRSGGFLSNPNLSAALILPTIPLMIQGRKSRFSACLLTAATSIFLLLTGSRASVLAALAMFLILLPPGKSRKFLFFSIPPLAFVGMGWRLISHPESLAWFRLKIWAAVITFLSTHPLFGSGSGPLSSVMGSFRIPHPTEPGTWGHVIGGAENSILGLAARIGLPGLLLAGFALVLWLLKLRPLSRWKLAFLACIGVFILFHDMLEEPVVLWWWAAAAALLDHQPKHTVEENHRMLVPALALAATAGLLVLAPSWAIYRWWSTPPSVEHARSLLYADPWCSPARQYLVEHVLQDPVLSWDQALAAIGEGRRDCRLRPGLASTWDRQGLLCYRAATQLGAYQELIDEAQLCFTRARSLETQLPWYSYHLALLERLIGRQEAALTALEDAVDKEPHFAKGWLLMAHIQLDLGETEGARMAMAHALRCREMLRAGRATIPYHRELLSAPAWQFHEIEDILR